MLHWWGFSPAHYQRERERERKKNRQKKKKDNKIKPVWYDSFQ